MVVKTIKVKDLDIPKDLYIREKTIDICLCESCYDLFVYGTKNSEGHVMNSVKFCPSCLTIQLLGKDNS